MQIDTERLEQLSKRQLQIIAQRLMELGVMPAKRHQLRRLLVEEALTKTFGPIEVRNVETLHITKPDKIVEAWWFATRITHRGRVIWDQDPNEYTVDPDLGWEGNIMECVSRSVYRMTCQIWDNPDLALWCRPQCDFINQFVSGDFLNTANQALREHES